VVGTDKNKTSTVGQGRFPCLKIQTWGTRPFLGIVIAL